MFKLNIIPLMDFRYFKTSGLTSSISEIMNCAYKYIPVHLLGIIVTTAINFNTTIITRTVLGNLEQKVSHAMRKGYYGICGKIRPGSDCRLTQSDLGL